MFLESLRLDVPKSQYNKEENGIKSILKKWFIAVRELEETLIFVTMVNPILITVTQLSYPVNY
jgi:hypothetical protein